MSVSTLTEIKVMEILLEFGAGERKRVVERNWDVGGAMRKMKETSKRIIEVVKKKEVSR